MIGIGLRLATGCLIVLAGMSFLQVAAAQDDQGCEGFADYREAMLEAGTAYVDALEEDGILADRDPMTYSTAEWESLSDHSAAWQAALKAIEAPEWVVDWHQFQIELAGLQEQLGIAVAASGVMGIPAFDDSFDANRNSAAAAAEDAAVSCPAFADFLLVQELLGGNFNIAFEFASSGIESEEMPGVMTYDYPGGQHSTENVAYTESPPVGGFHDPAWQTCGFYDSPVRNENAVHSLEHGVVWITYVPDLPADQVEQLRLLAGTDDYLLISPYDDQTSPIVATAWNNQLEIASATDPALEAFIEYFLQGPQTPEPGATCSGGVTTPND